MTTQVQAIPEGGLISEQGSVPVPASFPNASLWVGDLAQVSDCGFPPFLSAFSFSFFIFIRFFVSPFCSNHLMPRIVSPVFFLGGTLPSCMSFHSPLVFLFCLFFFRRLGIIFSFFSGSHGADLAAVLQSGNRSNFR